MNTVYIHMTCTDCGQKIEFPKESVGQNFNCPTCGGAKLAKPDKVLSLKTVTLIAALFALLVALLCGVLRPKTVTATGQMFIVTKGGENVKLGAISVIIASQDYIRNQMPSVTAAVRSRMQELNSNTAKAKSEYLFATNNYDSAVEAACNQSPNYARLRSEINTLEAKANSLELLASRSDDPSQSVDLLSESIKVRDIIVNDSDALNTIWSYITTKITLNVLRAEKNYIVLKGEESRFPGPEDYFSLLNVRPAITSVTDADGRFTLVYRLTDKFSVIALAQRAAPSGDEHYLWLINAPTNSGQLLLNNRNLATVDPDRYFPIRPKEENAINPVEQNEKP